MIEMNRGRISPLTFSLVIAMNLLTVGLLSYDLNAQDEDLVRAQRALGAGEANQLTLQKRNRSSRESSALFSIRPI